MLPYLQMGLNGAAGTAATQLNNGFYGGPLYAGLNQNQLAALGAMQQFGTNGIGANSATALSSAGYQGLGALQQGANAAGQVANMATSDPTQRLVQDAGAFSNNPYIQGQITAANTPIQQNLTMETLPGINSSAAQTGNTDSSRAGTQAAIATNLASTAEANNAANIDGNAWNKGLNTASSNYNTGLYAGSMAANALTNAGSTAAGMLNSGYQMGVNNNNNNLAVGSALQQNQQNQDSANYQQWQGQTNYPWQVLQNYWGIAGNPNTLGTTGNSNTQGNTTVTGGGPGLFGSLLGAASGIGSFFAPTGMFGTGPSMFSNLKNLFSGGSPGQSAFAGA